jgi:Cysteine rich repeat
MRAIDCLETNRYEPDFSAGCREALEVSIAERASDFRLDASLRAACSKDIERRYQRLCFDDTWPMPCSCDVAVHASHDVSTGELRCHYWQLRAVLAFAAPPARAAPAIDSSACGWLRGSCVLTCRCFSVSLLSSQVWGGSGDCAGPGSKRGGPRHQLPAGLQVLGTSRFVVVLWSLWSGGSKCCDSAAKAAALLHSSQASMLQCSHTWQGQSLHTQRIRSQAASTDQRSK